MRITELYLDGFGIYNQESISDLPGGLAVFIGKNESGKTTLMEFIRTMIFGFPSGRAGKSVNLYPPLGNGIHGGKLGIYTKDGSRYLINRVKKSVTITDATGEICDFEPSAQWLGGLDRATFQKVFAIGLGDLQGLAMLSQDNVRSRFFAAGTGSGGASLVSSIGRIDNQLAQLFLPRGREQRINKLLKELEDTTRELREIRKEEIRYAELASERRELVQEIAREEQQSRALLSRLIELEQMERAWEPWVQLQWQTEKARTLEFAKDFPPNGIVRFEQLLQRRDEYTITAHNKEIEKQKLADECNSIVVDSCILAATADVERLYAEKGRFESDVHSYPSQEIEVGTLRVKYQQALAQIGPGWDDSMLEQVDISVPIRQKVQAYAGSLRELSADLKQLEIAEKQNTTTLADLQQELENHQALRPSVGSTIKNEQQVESLEEGLRTIRNAILQRQQLAFRKIAADKEGVEVTAQLSSLDIQETGYQSALSNWLWMATLLLSLAIGCFLFWQGWMLVALVAVATGIALSIILVKQKRRQDEVRATWFKHTATERQRLQLRQSTISKEQSEINQFMKECSGLIAAAAGQMGVATPETPEDTDDLEREIIKIRKRYQSWTLYHGRERELQAKTAKVQAALANLLREKNAALGKYATGCREWENWLAERHFSIDISPESFEIVLKAIETACNAREQYLKATRSLQRLNEYIEGVKSEIGALLTRCGRRIPGDISAKELEMLYQDLTNSKTQERRKNHLGEMAVTLEREIGNLQVQAKTVQEEIAELLRQGFATKEEQFRKMAQSHQEWNRCVQNIETLTAALRAVAGTAEQQADLADRLSKTNMVAIAAEKEQLQRDRVQLEDSVTEKPKQVGAIELRLQQMSQDETLNRLLTAQNEKTAQVRRCSREWGKLILCRYLLEEARSIYERERQPSVIQEADKFLQLMTDNRYKMIAAIGGSDVQLEDSAKNIKGEITWSNGLADQVYLSIRLGLAQEFGRLVEAVPLILDDILVKFDSTREKGAARALLSVAKTQQVLLFSCHERTMDIVKEVHSSSGYGDTPVAYYEVGHGKVRRLLV